MIARALTSVDPAEVARQLAELARSASADGRIHESFDANDPARFTRAEFGWANAMYAELLFRAAAGAAAQPVAPPFGRSAMLARSISVVDRETALANRAALLRAFDQAVPMDAAFSRGSGAEPRFARARHRLAWLAPNACELFHPRRWSRSPSRGIGAIVDSRPGMSDFYDGASANVFR
jgi:hypothetical protein